MGCLREPAAFRREWGVCRGSPGRRPEGLEGRDATEGRNEGTLQEAPLHQGFWLTQPGPPATTPPRPARSPGPTDLLPVLPAHAQQLRAVLLLQPRHLRLELELQPLLQVL